MVKRKLYIVLVLAAVGALLLWSVALGKDLPGSKTQANSLSKVTGNPQYQILNINNLVTWMRADGESNHSPAGGVGVTYPVGTAGVVYEDGFEWGAKIFLDAAKTKTPTVQPIRVEGSTYLGNGFIGVKGGNVTGSGATAVAQNANDADVRCFRVRRDYFFMSDAELAYDAQTTNELASPSSVTQTMKDKIFQQYDTDWKNWPVAKGAPYIERNGIPGYQAPPPFTATFTPDMLISGKYDEPGVAGADPGSPADQVIWTVYNDLDGSQSVKFTGSQPSGVEVQKTVWGYKRTDAMGNIYFTRYRMINKGGVDVGSGVKGSFWLDSLYVCQWSDIDLGDSGDDLTGCDSTMSLAYTYNGFAVDSYFQKYNLPPPCSGYDFLAGPTVASAKDSAIFNLQRVKGKRNLPMSSYVYFSASSPYSDPYGPTDSRGSGYSSCAFQWYAMLRGYAPSGVFGQDLSRYLVPPGVDPNTKYMMSGDPVARTGFIDGLGTNYSFAPGDRRMLLNSGPFTLAPGDTQEVYVGFVVGLGADRLSSVSVMKFNDQFVQNTFDALFQVPKPPPNPHVVVAELNQKIVLDWGSDATTVNNIENKPSEPGHYVFEGYNVYQLPASNSTLRDAKRLATYDLASDPAVVTDLQPVSGVIVAVPVQFGTNSGITRYFEFTKDRVKDIEQIYNGQEYYLAVTAYSIATVKGYLPQQLECTPIIITATPHQPAMGTRTQSAFADTILPAHIAGSASGSFNVKIVNPLAVTGDVYQVEAVNGPAKRIILSTGDTLNAFDMKYKLVDLTKGTVVLAANQNFGLDPSNIILPDGFQFGFQANPYYVEGNEVADYTYPAGWAKVNQLNPYVGGAGFFPGTLKPFQVTKDVEIDFLGTPNSKAAGQKAYDFIRTASSGSGGAPYGGFFAQPFTVWDITAGAHRQIDFAFMEVIGSTFQDSVWAPPATSGDREYAWIIDQDYSATAKSFYTATSNVNSLAGVPVLYAFWLVGPKPAYKAGDKLIIHASVALGANDKWTFTTAGRQVMTTADKKTDINRITVFPNPYYCINSAETSRFVKFIQFTNMPTVATVRIFNLAGQLVRTLHKNDTSTFFKWDLANEIAYPVASGMYLAYIDIPDVGSKVLKIAVIQEQELLDVY